MPRDATIVLRRFSNMAQAEMARIALEASGIVCFLSQDDCGGMEPYLQSSNGVRLMIRRDDQERANDVLAEASGTAQ